MTATAIRVGSEPWRDVGMSERTFYRWKAQGKPIPQPQHAAHVEAYEQALDPFARLDRRSEARRQRILPPLPWTPAHLAPFAGAA